MAKRSSRNGSKPVQVSEDDLGLQTDTYVTDKGIHVTLSGLPPLLIPMIANSVVFPKKPTYTFQDVSGEDVVVEHDEKTLKTDEDKKAWADYEEAKAAADNQVVEKLLNLCLLEGVQVDLSPIDKWKKRQALIGIPIPEDPDELEMMYKRSVVISSSKDITHVMKRCMELTGVSPEEVNAIQKSFPDKVES